MQVELTSKSVRTMASRLSKAYPDISRPLALEMLAKALGYRNFDTLSGLLKQEVLKESAPPLPDLSLFGNAVELWMEAYVCDDFGDGPSWAMVALDAPLVTRILKMQATCQNNALGHVSEWESPSDWEEDAGYGSRFNMQDWQLYVSSDRFWFRGHPKHCSTAVETRGIRIEELMSKLSCPTGTGSASDTLAWVAGALFWDGDSAEAWLEELPYLPEGHTLADLAEWVGLHYKKNFFTESVSAQYEWVCRYREAHPHSSAEAV